MNIPDEKIRDEQKEAAFTVFIDGAGARPDGDGSGFAWVCPTTKQKKFEHVSGLTNNQAEYRALIAALMDLPMGAQAEVFSDSQLVCFQFSGKYRVKDPELADLLARAHSVIADRAQRVTVQWVPRYRNLAGKFLDQQKGVFSR